MGQAKDVVERWWQAFVAGDVAGAQAQSTDAVVFKHPDGEAHGKDEVRAVIEAFLTAFSNFEDEYVDWVEADQTFAGELPLRATNTGPIAGPAGELPATGRPVVFEAVDYIKLEDGKIASWHAYWDRLALLGQLGLLPPAGASSA